MAEVLATHPVADGTDVVVQLSNGRKHIFHLAKGASLDNLSTQVAELETPVLTPPTTEEPAGRTGAPGMFTFTFVTAKRFLDVHSGTHSQYRRGLQRPGN